MGGASGSSSGGGSPPQRRPVVESVDNHHRKVVAHRQQIDPSHHPGYLHDGLFGPDLPVSRVGDEGRRTILEQYADRLRNIDNDAPMFFHRLEDYDELSRLKPGIEPGTPCQHRGTRKPL